MKFTHRTRDGRKAYILPEQGTEKRPVLAVVQSYDCKDTFYCEAYSKNLKVREVAGGWGDSPNDLFEYNPAMELKVDQPIWVRLRSDMKWVKRHFCKFYNGKLYCWAEGKTSFTSTKYDDWNFYGH